MPDRAKWWVNMKLLEHFYQVGGNCLSHKYDASVYLIEGNNGLHLIECGTPDGIQKILENIRSMGVDPAQIEDIYATHGHYDHIGASAWMKKTYGCKLYVAEKDIQQVEEGDNIRTTAQILYDREFEPCRVDQKLENGQTIDFGNGVSMEVIETPGHTQGSVCFSILSNGIRLLVAGDTVYGGFLPEIGSDIRQWKQSMHLLTSRHFDAMTFGHIGPTLLCDADARLRELEMQLGVYYNPWFKAMKDSFRF